MLLRPRESNREIGSLFVTSSKGRLSKRAGKNTADIATCQPRGGRGHSGVLPSASSHVGLTNAPLAAT